MATSLQINPHTSTAGRPSRCLHLWHLLSLDAPTVAVVWTAGIARVTRSALGRGTLPAMFCAVWIIYAADRLLDTRTHADELELRHHFHARHRRALLKAICFAAVALALLTPSITWAQLRLDVVLASVLFVWMLTIHTLRRALPKEFLVGPFFAAAAFIPCANWLHILLPAVLFAALCTLNCLSIRAWEQRAASPTYATLALMVIAAATPTLRPITAAIALAALLLLVLQRTGRRFDATTLRALADLALLTPLLLAFWPK